MSALLLTIALFAGWAVIGLAMIVALGGDARSLRAVLVAPAAGTCPVLIGLFSLSRAGLDISRTAIPLAAVLGLLALAGLIRARPRLPWAQVAAALAVAALGLAMVAGPMLDLGYRWVGNGNDDMANFVLGAARLLHTPFSAAIDFDGLARGIDYPTVTAHMDVAHARPAPSIFLAFVQRLTGLTGQEVFMPVIVSMHLAGLCAAGALALQAVRRWWAAPVAMALLAVSPLATYGITQQLLAQVLGLALGCALVALLMRRELHTAPGPAIGDAVLIGVVFTALLLAYPELTPTIGLAYLAYLGVLAARRQIDPTAALRLWWPAAAFALFSLNVFVPETAGWLSDQVSHGTRHSAGPPLFGYSLTPTALPATMGLDSFAPDVQRNLDVPIAVGAALLAGALIIAALGAWRGRAAALVLLVQAGLAALLYKQRADFGLFKLMMFVQPFLAATLAAWLVGLRRLRWTLAGLAALVPLVVAQVPTQRDYVQASRDPIDVRHASSPAQLPAFRDALDRAGALPIVSATDNVVLIKLQAAVGRGHEVRFISRHPSVDQVLGPNDADAEDRKTAIAGLRRGPWRVRRFDLAQPGPPVHTTFRDDGAASALLRSGECLLVLPSGSQVPFNRRRLPEGGRDLAVRPCRAPKNLLAFTNSDVGRHYYLSPRRSAVSFFQLQPDYFYPGHTMSAFGRYALFRALGPSSRVRLAVELTASLRGDGVNRLPPASAIGAARVALPITGRGSARVFSAALRPQMIAGQAYVMLDMGEPGRLPPVPRHGLERIYGANVPLDTRYVTTYVRDVSLIDERELSRLRVPTALRSFPADLADPSLEYSGIYEDGWVGESAHAVLAAGRGDQVIVTGDTRSAERLQVLVDGREALRTRLPAGHFSVHAPARVAGRRVRVELRFGSTLPLPAPDLRPAAAHITFLGFGKRSPG
ncbi:MAG: hypothetical protein QOE65_2208 [Solirubrobacteraceae bacterium]|nr:hypothetical protein [Solirubrobacteraceae bacterium]